ncbi:hypothetical protein NKH77_45820 [Streptomyces sp. M19]
MTAPARHADPAEVVATLRSLHGRLEQWLPLVAERRKLAEQWHAATGQDPASWSPNSSATPR